MQHWNLLLITLALMTFALLLITLGLVYRQISPRSKSSAQGVPDFTIVDCGGSIHLVPVETDYHQVDNSGRCPCGPMVSLNKRRGGADVRYVDHHQAGRRTSLPSNVNTRR
jgi:hypothetical protein